MEGGLVPGNPLKGEIEFQSVAFSYPSRPDVKVLDGLSLKVPSDRVTGLVTISISFSLLSVKKHIDNDLSFGLYLSSKQLHQLCLGPLKGFSELTVPFKGQSCKDTVMCDRLGSKVSGSSQKHLT